MTGKDVQNLFAIFYASPSAQRVPEHCFRQRVMLLATKREHTWFARRRDGPTRECARYLDDIVLRIPAIDAKRMELQQLAGVVLIESILSAQVVVEIKQHGRTVRHRAEQVAEFSKCARAEDVAIPHDERFARRHLSAEDREMILPEIGDHLQ